MSLPVLNNIGATIGLSDGWSRSYSVHQFTIVSGLRENID